MGLIIKPALVGDDITVEIDKSDEAARRIMNTWGHTIPLLKIGDYFVTPGDIISFDMEVKLNSLPTFNFLLDDSNLMIRKALSAKIDKCTVNIGFKTWHIKFNGLILSVTSQIGEANITLTGILYNELLYKNFQKSFVDSKFEDIFLSLAEDTKMGLYTIDNKWLKEEHDFILNPNMRYINFFDWCIKNYTENLWCIDPVYFFHIGDIIELRKKCDAEQLDLYTLRWDGEQVEPKPIIFNSYQYPLGNTEADYKIDDEKFRIDFYTIVTNYSEIYKNSHTQYFVNNTEEIVSNPEIGFGTTSINTFLGDGSEERNGFSKHTFPYYLERINKLIGGTLIRISLKNIMFEITPFDIVKFECYMPSMDDKPQTKDEEHSGNKIVIGYTYTYDRATEDNRFPTIVQTIDLI